MKKQPIPVYAGNSLIGYFNIAAFGMKNQRKKPKNRKRRKL